MPKDKLVLSNDMIRYRVDETLRQVCVDAEKIRLLGLALETSAGEFLADSPPDGLRQLAAILKTHALGVLMGALDLANGAGQLEAMADTCDSADSSND